MKKYGLKDTILGVMVTARAVHAVLVQEGPEGPTVLRRFRRQRNAQGSEPVGGTDMGFDFGGEAGDDDMSASDEDFTIQFGGNSGGGELFLGSEFGDLAPENGFDPVGAALPSSFELELVDILSECDDAGYPDPAVSFVVGSTDVSTYEVRLQPSNKKKNADKDGEAKGKNEDRPARKKNEITADRSTLLSLLAEQHETQADPDRVAFIQMTLAEDGRGRYLAIALAGTDTVISTVASLREQKTATIDAQVLDVELSLYMGITRVARELAPPDGGAGLAGLPSKSLVVRAGLEDTIVLFLQDGVLQHYESLRSITTYDAPETICSRVLLLQDEYGVGDVDQVLLLGDEREDALVDSFEMFFPETRVESLRAYLPKGEYDEEGREMVRSTLLATLAGLRCSANELYAASFGDLNLMPKKLLKKQFKMPISWPVVALYVMLFATSLFFVSRYFSQQHTIDQRQYALEQFPDDIVNADPQVLQARIDSLQRVHESFISSLNVLDSLLVGSDRWSRAMEHSSDKIQDVSGLWIEQWRPKGGVIELVGNATSRESVVNFANQASASIETLTYSEIREWRVYSFTMTLPLTNDLPEAAKYLRERARVDDLPVKNASQQTSDSGTPANATGTP